jgi:hypothetical protein
LGDTVDDRRELHQAVRPGEFRLTADGPIVDKAE